MERPRASAPTQGRGRAGLSRVDGRVLVAALDEAHGPALEDVDRRIEDHAAARAATRAADAAKLRSSASPWAEDFSGWNWTPKSGVALIDGRREALAVLAGAEHIGGLGGTRREGVHVVEGALVREAGGERRGPGEADEVPADVGQLAPAGSSRVTGPPGAGPARPRRPARPRTRTAAASPGRCRAPAPRPRAAPAPARRGPARAGCPSPSGTRPRRARRARRRRAGRPGRS